MEFGISCISTGYLELGVILVMRRSKLLYHLGTKPDSKNQFNKCVPHGVIQYTMLSYSTPCFHTLHHDIIQYTMLSYSTTYNHIVYNVIIQYHTITQHTHYVTYTHYVTHVLCNTHTM